MQKLKIDKKAEVSVSLRQDQIDRLDMLAKEERCSRSYILQRIIDGYMEKEHMQ